MIKQLPDNWVKKAVYDSVNNLTILDPYTNANITVPCYNIRVPANGGENHYILLTSQTNDQIKPTKCGDEWQSSLLIDVVTSFYGTGNAGTDLLANNIMNEVLQRIEDLTLDVASGLTVLRQNVTLYDVSTITVNENIFRKLARLEMTIN